MERRPPASALAWLLTALVLAPLVAASPADAAVFNVASGDVSGLIAAIDAANANGEADTINLAAGTYTLTSGPYGGAGLPSLTSEITIVGPAPRRRSSSATRVPRASAS
jgi:hypothetical protein